MGGGSASLFSEQSMGRMYLSQGLEALGGEYVVGEVSVKRGRIQRDDEEVCGVSC